ncbi:TonB-dependent siderophore receptor [Pseudomonas putida]|uniref:TonB-dependent siderophore receptor n=1 Tax=Pseudomonas putida TaxID=303 RepID=UPI0030CF898A
MHPRVTRHSYPRKPLVVAMFSAALLLQGGVVHPLTSAGRVSAAEAARSYSIAAGPLGAVLSRFASDTGVVLSFEAELTQGKHSPGLQGTYSVEQGFARLLAGSDLQVMAASNGNYVLLPRSKDGALELGATSINASGLGATTEATGSYTTGLTSTATKMNLSIRETPQSISVITRQQMDDQHLASMTDVLNQTPGVTMSQDGGERYNIYARGSAINTYQFDGVNTTQENQTRNMPSTLLDMALYDRVEVVRGATGLMTGAGDPSAVVNLVRKKPTHEFQSSFQSTVGAWDYYRAEADVAGPLNEQGSVRGRFVTAKQDNKSYMDWYSQKRDILYGVVEADVTDSTLIRFGVDYQKYKAMGSPGVPLLYNNGAATNFSRSTSSGSRWSYDEFETTNYTLTFEQTLANDWKARLVTNYMDIDRDSPSARYRSTSGLSYLDPVTGAASLERSTTTADQTQRGVDFSIQGPLELFGQTHELIAGYNYSDYENNHYSTSGGIVSVDFNNWENEVDRGTYVPGLDFDISSRQSGYYLAARLNFTENLHLILGARASNYSYDYYLKSLAVVNAKPTTYGMTERGVVTPYAGLIYDLTPEQSVYVSYTDIFKPQSNVDIAGKPLDPEVGKNYELGWKGEFYNGRLNANIAAFMVKRDNFAEDIGTNVPGTTIAASRPIDGAETKGFDLELSGEIAQGWNLHTGFSHAKSKNADGERLNTQLPLETFRLWNTYRLPGEWDKLMIGGGVNWNSSSSLTYTRYNTKIKQDDYAVTSLMARYKLNENLAATLNLNNVFDKKYYAGMAGSYGHYGAPRNATLNLRYDF